MAGKSKVLPYVIFGVPLLIGGYFIFRAVRKYVQKKKEESGATNDGGANTSTGGGGNTSTGGGGNTNTGGGGGGSTFPLRKGSRGSKVKELQQAILSKNSSLLPKYGADSDFGSETESAVNSLLGKKTVDSQAEIDSIKSGSTSGGGTTPGTVDPANYIIQRYMGNRTQLPRIYAKKTTTYDSFKKDKNNNVISGSATRGNYFTGGKYITPQELSRWNDGRLGVSTTNADGSYNISVLNNPDDWEVKLRSEWSNSLF